MNRVEQLESFLRDDPGDAFSMYALALEYLKSDQKRSLELFESLLRQQPDYLPTYYPFAHLLLELQQPERAEQIFQQGIDLARRLNNHKTLKELNTAYNDWLYNN